MRKIHSCIAIVSILTVATCGDPKQTPKPKYYKPQSKGFTESDNCMFLKYKYVGFDYKGKHFSIPIYGGTMPPVLEKDIREFLSDKRVTIIGNLCFRAPKGHVSKTFRRIIAFYGKTILKNADTNFPTIIGREGLSDGGQWIIYYDYAYNDMIGNMQINIAADEKFKEYPNKDIRKIKFPEDVSTIITVGFEFGARSPFYKK